MSKNILILGASTSKNSINKQLATYAGSKLKEATPLLIDLNDFKMPLYSIDREEKKGFPKRGVKLSKKLDKVDGFIISLAEHNGTYTAAFKNAMDWLSRIRPSLWDDKPMLLLSTSPGARAGQSVMEAAQSRFPRMGAKLTGSFSLPSFTQNFESNKGITEATLDAQLTEQVASFEAGL